MTLEEQGFIERDRHTAMDRLVALTHELGLYDDCAECRRTGGHE